MRPSEIEFDEAVREQRAQPVPTREQYAAFLVWLDAEQAHNKKGKLDARYEADREFFCGTIVQIDQIKQYLQEHIS